MYSYILASVQDPDDHQRLNLSAAFAWIDPSDYLVRIGSRSQDPLFVRITEADSLALKEWLTEKQRDPTAALSDIAHVVSRNSRYPVASEFALKTIGSMTSDKFAAFEQKRDSEQIQKGGGKRQKGHKNDSLGGSSPSYTAQPARGEAAIAGLRAQEHQRVARNARMNRLQQTTGFVKGGPQDRIMARPEACRQSQRGPFHRGVTCRYARNDLELRLLEGLTRRRKKIAPAALRSGRVDFGGSSTGNANVAFEQKFGIACETLPPLGGGKPQEGEDTPTPCEMSVVQTLNPL